MTHEEALKAASAQKVEAGYLRLKLTYKNGILIPYAEGIKLLAALSGAEYYEDRYSETAVIRGLEGQDLEFDFCTANDRRDLHMAQLLNIPLSEVKAMHQQAKEKPEPF